MMAIALAEAKGDSAYKEHNFMDRDSKTRTADVFRDSRRVL